MRDSKQARYATRRSPVKATPVDRSLAPTAPNATSSRASRSASPRGALARNTRSRPPSPAAEPAVFNSPARSTKVEPGRLQLGVLLERMQRLVAADSRLF